MATLGKIIIMIKEKSQTWVKCSEKLGVWFDQLPFHHHFYTWMTIPVALVGLLMIIKLDVWSGVLLYTLAGVFDVIDGALARHRNQASGYGAFLDGSLDRFIDFIVIFSYFWIPIKTPWMPLGHWIAAAIFFALMPSFEVAYANHRKAVEDPEEKLIWRILNRGEMYVLMMLIPVVSIHSSRWGGYLLILLVGLSIVTTFQTLFHTLKLSKT